jgi:hypothetical protein
MLSLPYLIQIVHSLIHPIAHKPNQEETPGDGFRKVFPVQAEFFYFTGTADMHPGTVAKPQCVSDMDMGIVHKGDGDIRSNHVIYFLLHLIKADFQFRFFLKEDPRDLCPPGFAEVAASMSDRLRQPAEWHLRDARLSLCTSNNF